ncbi:conjugal transfer protein TrbC, partial [Escherichia coli]|nr:conjugal transfer protein TrbC [Escherichia coli]
YRIIDTFQKQLNETQTSLDLLPQYDTDISARGNSLWNKAVHIINTTSREERHVCYITQSCPEEERVEEKMPPSVAQTMERIFTSNLQNEA